LSAGAPLRVEFGKEVLAVEACYRRLANLRFFGHRQMEKSNPKQKEFTGSEPLSDLKALKQQ